MGATRSPYGTEPPKPAPIDEGAGGPAEPPKDPPVDEGAGGPAEPPKDESAEVPTGPSAEAAVPGLEPFDAPQAPGPEGFSAQALEPVSATQAPGPSSDTGAP